MQLVFVDSTQGWLVESVADQGGSQAAYTVATGGTITTSGDFKIRTFTGDGLSLIHISEPTRPY